MARCAACKRALRRGQLAREVNTPAGPKRVHEGCLAAPPKPQLRSLDGDQVEILPRARPLAPPRPEQLPELYATGRFRPAGQKPEASREARRDASRERGAQLDLGTPFRGPVSDR